MLRHFIIQCQWCLERAAQHVACHVGMFVGQSGQDKMQSPAVKEGCWVKRQEVCSVKVASMPEVEWHLMERRNYSTLKPLRFHSTLLLTAELSNLEVSFCLPSRQMASPHAAACPKKPSILSSQRIRQMLHASDDNACKGCAVLGKFGAVCVACKVKNTSESTAFYFPQLQTLLWEKTRGTCTL